MARKSPKYPNYQLNTAIENVRKVYDADRTSPLPREVIAKHLGYSGISGTSDGAIATLVQYGLLERVGKGEMKVSKLAVDIIVPEDESQKQEAVNRAALNPPLFSEIWNHFGKYVPSEEALKTYLLRREFNDRAIDPIMRAFAPTVAMTKQKDETESGLRDEEKDEESTSPSSSNGFGEVKASIGDHIQWESNGTLQFEHPRRVRAISDDDCWVCVDGSETWIPMEQVSIEKRFQSGSNTPPPPLPEENPRSEISVGADERLLDAGQLSKAGAAYKVIVSGEIGVREIDTLIKKLEISKDWLSDADED